MERAMLKMSIAVLALVLVGTAYAAAPCKQCAAWNRTQQPFKVYGNTYYVGVHGLSSILITSDRGHVLIDGDLTESAPKIAASIRALGFRLQDVKLILNSHVHSDHAGGIAELQRLSGAMVAASRSSAQVLQQGHSGPDDPQYGELRPIPPVAHVKIVEDGETLHVGPLQLTAHLTPGHTPGGTSWTWKSCESQRCLNMVYADSLSSLSGAHFRFTHSLRYPTVLTDFQKSFATLSALPCDILLTPHPDASDVLARFGGAAGAPPSVDPTACRRYAARYRDSLNERLEREKGN